MVKQRKTNLGLVIWLVLSTINSSASAAGSTGSTHIPATSAESMIASGATASAAESTGNRSERPIYLSALNLEGARVPLEGASVQFDSTSAQVKESLKELLSPLINTAFEPATWTKEHYIMFPASADLDHLKMIPYVAKLLEALDNHDIKITLMKLFRPSRSAGQILPIRHVVIECALPDEEWLVDIEFLCREPGCSCKVPPVLDFGYRRTKRAKDDRGCVGRFGLDRYQEQYKRYFDRITNLFTQSTSKERQLKLFLAGVIGSVGSSLELLSVSTSNSESRKLRVKLLDRKSVV